MTNPMIMPAAQAPTPESSAVGAASKGAAQGSSQDGPKFADVLNAASGQGQDGQSVPSGNAQNEPSAATDQTAALAAQIMGAQMVIPVNADTTHLVAIPAANGAGPLAEGVQQVVSGTASCSQADIAPQQVTPNVVTPVVALEGQDALLSVAAGAAGSQVNASEFNIPVTMEGSTVADQDGDINVMINAGRNASPLFGVNSQASDSLSANEVLEQWMNFGLPVASDAVKVTDGERIATAMNGVMHGRNANAVAAAAQPFASVRNDVDVNQLGREMMASAGKFTINAQNVNILQQGQTAGFSSDAQTGGDSLASAGNSDVEVTAPFATAVRSDFDKVMTDAVKQTSATQAITSDAEVTRRIIDQVVREVKLTQLDGRSDLVIKLTPPELGQLKVQLTQDATGITSQITASSDQVKSMLQSHLPNLVDALREAGVKLDTVQVTSNATPFGSLAQDAERHQAQQDMPHRPRQRYNYSDNTPGAAAVAASAVESSTTSGSVGHSWLA